LTDVENSEIQNIESRSRKGELYQKLGAYLELQGFRVLAFNLVDMDDSDCYNPFAYIRSDNDIIKLVINMMNNTKPKDAKGGDPFWDNALSLYLQAIMSYVWYECPKMGKEATIREMMDLLTKAKVAEKAGDLSELDKMMEVLPDDHPAKIAYLKVRSGAKDTIRSIIISAHARLAYLQNPKVLKILDHDDCLAQRHWVRIYTVTLTGSLSHFRYSPWRTRRESVPEARPWSATRSADSWKTGRSVRIRMLI